MSAVGGMKIVAVRTLAGPNVFHNKPILRVDIELGRFSETASNEIPGFAERLEALLPEISNHRCSKGYPGGFIERLQTGTYPAHILEHIIIALMERAGCAVGYGKTINGGRPGFYQIALRYIDEAATRYLVNVGLDVLNACMSGESIELKAQIEKAKRLHQERELGPSTRAIVSAAERRGIPWKRLNEGSLIQFGYGNQRRFVEATEDHFTSAIGESIAKDKSLTKRLLEEAGIPVPAGVVISQSSEIAGVCEQLAFPLVVKPLDGNQGRGITIGVADSQELDIAVERAFKVSSEVLVEELFVGNDYRVVVVAGKIVAASRRTAASVTGDGQHSVSELVEIENRNPLRGEGHEMPLTRITINDCALEVLRKQQLTPESVPAKDQQVFLRATGNLSTGGTAIDVTDDIHPEIARACVRAAQAISLNICGVDLIHPDISKPFPAKGAGIIELNAGPGIRMHQYPSEGKARDVGEAIIESLYPSPSNGRIPVLSVTGTNGKTTVTRMLAHLVASTGKRVGMTSTEGVYVGGNCVAKGDATGFYSATTVLSDPTVDAAVLEVARGGIVRRGLAYDWSDVGILTNIQADHFGQDNIENLEDLVSVKSVIAERVRKGGTLILNADDEILRFLPERDRIASIPRAIWFFTLERPGHTLLSHVQQGGVIFAVENGWIQEYSRSGKQRIVPVSEIPQSGMGTILFQISNALAAIAGARAYGCSPKQIRDALGSFGRELNPGRFNWYEVNGGHLIVDYGHNPGAFRAMNGVLARWSGRKTGVVGLPGDRTDELLREAAEEAVREFDRVIIKEDYDLRGRARGETAHMIELAVQRIDPHKECVTVLDERDALQTAIDEIEPGELVVVFYDEHEIIKEVLRDNGARYLPDMPQEVRVIEEETEHAESWQ